MKQTFELDHAQVIVNADLDHAQKVKVIVELNHVQAIENAELHHTQ